METNAAALADRTCLEAEVCVVGAGPAGLVLAGALAEAGVRVALLESGGRRPDRRVEALSRGEAVGDDYGELASVRARRVGGSVHLWNTPLGPHGAEAGAKYVPLDPIDFEAREGLAGPGWPFGRDALLPFYRRAQALCGLGPFAYGAASWAHPTHPLPPLRGEALEAAVYQVGPADAFLGRALALVAGASRAELVSGATACALEPRAGGGRVEAVRARRLDGGELRVRAGRFVLAGGAIENARLLLLAEALSPGAGFDPHGRAGRGFMEHPRDRTLGLVPALGSVGSFFDVREAAAAGGAGERPGRALVVGRLALRGEVLRAQRLANASLTLLAPSPPPRGPLRRALARLGLGAPARGDAAPLARVPPGEPLALLLNLEQRPHPENRVALAGGSDALGLPRATLFWRWRSAERAALARLRELVAVELEASGFGRVVRGPDAVPDPRAHHHAGTTAMSADPRAGVVDADGRVHGLENLYAAGASVFPAAGFANPTLTIVALALRLAEHLAARRGS